MCNNLVLHIGLHKTGTTFLKKHVFPAMYLSGKRIVYNPKSICIAIDGCASRLAWGERLSKEQIASLKESISRQVKAATRAKATVLISQENISQSLACQNYEDHFELIRSVFNDFRIIITLRYQTDWILSCYRHFIGAGLYLGIEDFLNYRSGAFLYESDRFFFNIWKVNFPRIIDMYAKHYGKENVYVLFYEDLISNPTQFYARLSAGLNALAKVSEPVRLYKKENRGLSALSARLALFLNQALRIKPTPDIARKLLLVRTRIIHRALKYLDNMAYVDWDIIKDLRPKLDSIFKNQNLMLLGYVEKEQVPEIYLPAEPYGNAGSWGQRTSSATI